VHAPRRGGVAPARVAVALRAPGRQRQVRQEPDVERTERRRGGRARSTGGAGQERRLRTSVDAERRVEARTAARTLAVEELAVVLVSEDEGAEDRRGGESEERVADGFLHGGSVGPRWSRGVQRGGRIVE